MEAVINILQVLMNQVIQLFSTSVFSLCRQGFGEGKEQESEQFHAT